MIRHRQLIHSFGYAFEGVRHALQNDQNLRIHFIAAFFVMAASLYFRVTPFEMGILGVMIILVIVTEMINTAIENMVDLISKEYHAEAKVAKDVAAGMVLVTVVGSVIVGILVLLPYILRTFF